MVRNTKLLVWLYVSIVLFTLYFSAVSIVRHENFYARRLDLGNMDQTVWNVANGNGFVLTDPMGESSQSRLAVHADFLLILLAPLYFIWSNPGVLLITQALVAGLGAVPVYWIARKKLKSDSLALLFSSAFLLYPALQRIMLHDFHAVSLSTTFLLFAFWYMENRSYGYFALVAILAGLGKEDIWLVTGCMGLYILFIKRDKLVGVCVSAVSACIFYYLFWHAIPAVRSGSEHFAVSYLSSFGSNQTEIIFNIIRNPFTVLGVFFQPDRLYYYFLLLVPVGFLPLFAPWPVLFAAPSLLINILSSNTHMRLIDYQYNSSIIPFMMISSVYGYIPFTNIIQKVVKKYSTIKKYSLSVLWIVTMVLLSSYLWGNLPYGTTSWFWTFMTPPAPVSTMRRVAESIPSRYSVSVSNNIGAKFSQRRELYNFPVKAMDADYSVVYLGDPYAWPSGDAQNDAVESLRTNPGYVQIASDSGFWAFKRIGL